MVTGNLKIISDSRIRKIVSKGPKYRFPSYINFDKCREEISSALNDFGNRWCKREGVEDNALKEWKRSIFTIVDKRIKFYSQNTNLLPPKPKSSFKHLKQGIQEFHRKYVLVPADKAANNVVVVCRLLIVPSRYFCSGSFCFMSWCLKFFVLLAPYVCFHIFS